MGHLQLNATAKGTARAGRSRHRLTACHPARSRPCFCSRRSLPTTTTSRVPLFFTNQLTCPFPWEPPGLSPLCSHSAPDPLCDSLGGVLWALPALMHEPPPHPPGPGPCPVPPRLWPSLGLSDRHAEWLSHELYLDMTTCAGPACSGAVAAASPRLGPCGEPEGCSLGCCAFSGLTY